MGTIAVSADISCFKGVGLYNRLAGETSNRVAGEAEEIKIQEVTLCGRSYC